MREVLLLHGAPGHAGQWAPVLDRLPCAERVHAITLSFFGTQEVPEGGEAFGTERHADDIVAYVDNAMTPPVDAVAWSYSSHPLLLAALRRPDLFARLYLYEPGLPTYVTDQGELRAFEEDAGAAFGPIAAALQADGNEAAVAALFDSSGGEGCWVSLASDRQEIYLASCGMMPLLMGGGQPPTPISAEDVASLVLPLTVAMGSETRPVFAVPSRGLAKAVPTARLQIVDQSDHMLPEVDPSRFAELLEEWLECA
ncbi:alpha/beta fold hydrolase [Erythrobacter mangrovi]|uniref:Alpha/beta hydrolase n=1 Tax=Erythrobacter mangrovi TaxID=2739433 RepID=A0A7D3XSR8_9SPHN|nr:alpha/beta hydrolase [Erythrobacter mangrovi]QKG72011.1 alpha/beta hydrolase [Erythrobacter mangrovi]